MHFIYLYLKRKPEKSSKNKIFIITGLIALAGLAAFGIIRTFLNNKSIKKNN